MTGASRLKLLICAGVIVWAPAFGSTGDNPMRVGGTAKGRPMSYGMAFENSKKVGDAFFNSICAPGLGAGGAMREAGVWSVLKQIEITPCAEARK